MKLCINCDTENQDDEVFCSKCGMSLIGAPTDEHAIKLAEQRRAKRREETLRRLSQPPTASGIVYLFADQFVAPFSKSAMFVHYIIYIIKVLVSMVWQEPWEPDPDPVRVPCSGQRVEAPDLARKLWEAALVSLAQEGYISVGMVDGEGLFSGEVVAIVPEKSGDDLPPSLERSIMNALHRDPYVTRSPLRTLVAELRGHCSTERYPAHGRFAVVHIVAEALMEMGWLQRGVWRGVSVHLTPTEEAAPLLTAMAGEAETVKTCLENFAAQHPHTHAKLLRELKKACVDGLFGLLQVLVGIPRTQRE
jgi:hypothetical protein